MNDIQIKWYIDSNGRKFIISEDVSSQIEIDEENKELKKVKSFFREILYISYLNNWQKKITLLDDEETEITEVKMIINDIIQICNNKITAEEQ